MVDSTEKGWEIKVAKSDRLKKILRLYPRISTELKCNYEKKNHPTPTASAPFITAVPFP